MIVATNAYTRFRTVRWHGVRLVYSRIIMLDQYVWHARSFDFDVETVYGKII